MSAFHLEAHVAGAADNGIRIGIARHRAADQSLIGGRIVPSFTRNWLVRENPGRLPAPFGRFDVVVIASARGAGLDRRCRPRRRTGAALLLAGMLQLVRLARWAGDRTCGTGCC